MWRSNGLMNVAVKWADYIDSVFGPDKKRDVPGHQEIEIGLVKLYRQTGNDKYLKLAKFFLDERGQARGRKLYGEYCQDHKPVVAQSEAVGHAVRAGYMYCGMADVAALTGDTSYIRAIDRIWENVVTKKLYLTGGIGARHKGEAFGDNYELPNETAYCETCAAIANAMWNHRLFVLHGDAKYLDVLERVLYNGFLSGISLSGDKFFYPNPLASNGKKQRSAWFGCACCPTNIVRFVPSVGGYAYARSDDALYVNLFISGAGTLKLKNNTVTLKQLTGYPWQGDSKITVEPKRPAEFAVYIRIPGWARNKPVPSDLYKYMKDSDEKVALKVNGESVAVDMERGFARIRRNWKKGDVIELNLPMPIRRVLCKKKVKDNLRKGALERGPIVYCAEETDNGPGVHRLVISADVRLKPQYREDLFGGVSVLKGRIRTWHREQAYVYPDKQDFIAIPYYAWAHRSPGEMVVWLPRFIGFPEAGAQ
ncbi:MAG: glycoside hydrolase family 127 protein [Planctomycetota bacterium]